MTTNMDSVGNSTASTLCKSCGMCCTGHLFIWTKLRSAELDGIESLGLKVFREPGQRGFNQPCPLWDGQCTIYQSPRYPRFCQTYKCKLLKEVLEEITTLSEALVVVRQAKEMIEELDPYLRDLPGTGFRERLVARFELGDVSQLFRSLAKKLFTLYDTKFGVNDIVNYPREE